MEESKLIIQNEISNEEIKSLIYTIRGKQVMLDSDVARLFKYATKDLNRNVKNKEIAHLTILSASTEWYK